MKVRARSWVFVPVLAASGLWAGSPAIAADGAAVATVAQIVDAQGRPRFVEVHARTAAEERRRADSLPGSVGHAVDVPVRVADTPDDPGRPQQWALDALRADDLPAVSLTGRLVAVVDTGVDADHPDFAAGQVRCDLGTDLTGDGKDPAGTGCVDPEGHGTHVAGIVAAATDNGVGVASIAAGAQILPVRALDSAGAGTATNIASGIVYAVDHGATVVNVSASGDYSAVYDQAVAYAEGKGVPVVVAAGNNARTGDLPQWPAASPNAIGVGATDRDGTIASYSNTSGTVDIAAPGTDIYGLDAKTGGYVYKSGTSMATPEVTAAVTLYQAQHPTLTPAQIRQALAGTADVPGSSTTFDTSAFGAGVLDVYALISDEVPTVTLSTLKVSKRARITVRVAAFKPGTRFTVYETYRYAKKSIYISKTVALGMTRVSQKGTASRSIMPVQTAKSGKITIKGTGADGRALSISYPVTVG